MTKLNGRISIIDSINVRNILSSSILQVGDSDQLRPASWTLAVQREYPTFREGEWNFNDFTFYKEPLPTIDGECPVRVNTHNEVPVIKVGTVDILGIAASSMLHVGSTHNIDSTARVKHFREFFYPLTEEESAYFGFEDTSPEP